MHTHACTCCITQQKRQSRPPQHCGLRTHIRICEAQTKHPYTFFACRRYSCSKSLWMLAAGSQVLSESGYPSHLMK